jgi:hypothetical protein
MDKAVRAYYIIASTRFADGIYQNAVQKLLHPLQVGPFSTIMREPCVSEDLSAVRGSSTSQQPQ